VADSASTGNPTGQDVRAGAEWNCKAPPGKAGATPDKTVPCSPPGMTI
jgi:hypothetical protein